MNHEMSLVSTDDTGKELWTCYECGRKLVISWPPNYSKNVIVQGDDRTTHVGVKGGIQIGSTTVIPKIADITDDDIVWLRDTGIDWQKH